MRLKQLAIIGAASAVLLSGCAGSSSDASAPGEAVEFVDSSAGGEMASEDTARAMDADRQSSDVGANSEYLVREATLGIKVDAIADAADQVREIAVGAGGSVTSEQFGDSMYDPAGTDITRYGTMTISVPQAELDATLDRLAELGEVRTRSTNAYDVQDEYVDVEARIATLDASIDRMRALMERTEDIEQIVALETALSARQADLDSLQARLNALDQRISMSPVTLMLTTTDDLGEPDGGIIGALRDAWNAFTTSAALLITAMGALLPWLVVGALALWALIVGLRRLERRRQAKAARQWAQSAAAAPATPAAPADPPAAGGTADPTAGQPAPAADPSDPKP